MTKFCKHSFCDAEAIPRGKYCEEHRTNKRQKKNTSPIIASSSTSSPMSIEIESDGDQERKETLEQQIKREKMHKKREETRLKREEEQRLYMEEYNSMVETRRVVRENEQRRIEENRLLAMEQDEEYHRVVEEDKKRIREREEEKEIAEILKLSEEQYFIDKKQSIPDEPLENFYRIGINLPTGIKLIRKFPIDCEFENIRNYLDVYFYENKIKISNYDLVLNFPNRKFTNTDNKIKIKSLQVPQSFMLYLSNLDA